MIKDILFFLWWLGIVPALLGFLTFGIMMIYIANATNMTQTKVDNYKPLKVMPWIIGIVSECFFVWLLYYYDNF